MPKGSFSHYFPSKEAFVGELFERYAMGELGIWGTFTSFPQSNHSYPGLDSVASKATTIRSLTSQCR